jgi:inner membrane protein
MAVLGLVAGLDALLRAYGGDNSLVLAALDEPAHVATAWLFLDAVPTDPTTARWALVGSTVIDVDHLPQVLTGARTSGPLRRPRTHSLSTAAVLTLAGSIGPPRLRAPLRGLALGVVLHLARDLAEGPGVPLMWPFRRGDVRLPYLAYVSWLAGLAARETPRRRRSRRPASAP